MRAAEWIQSAVSCYFLALAWVRPLPADRRRTVTLLGLAILVATGACAFAAPMLLPPLAASVVRDWTPAALVLLVYRQAGAFFVRIDRQVQDRLHGLDRRLAAPFLLWVSRRSWKTWFAAYLEGAYLLCYPMVPMALAALYLLRLGSHADAFWSVVLTATYGSYAVLPFVQALPPRNLEEPWIVPLPSNPVRRFNLKILGRASIHATTFPSAHAAASVSAALVVASLAPWPVGALFGVIAFGITVGTFAGRYHYCADSIAGALVAVLVYLARIGLGRL